jgi:hypothetical protein
MVCPCTAVFLVSPPDRVSLLRVILTRSFNSNSIWVNKIHNLHHHRWVLVDSLWEVFLNSKWEVYHNSR